MVRPDSGTRYLTTIRDVGEVTLAGAADARYWIMQLGAQGLFPFLVDGKAQLALGATALRWLGIPFRELTLAVGVSASPHYDSNDGQFLTAAFNSSRPLAALERSLFRTPYQHAELRVDTGEPTWFELRDARGLRLAARMGSRSATPVATDSWWEGSILLPRAGGSRSYFRARLGGPQSCHAWDAAGDRLELPRPDDPLARLLEASRFEPLEWRIRASATHARSKTYARD